MILTFSAKTRDFRASQRARGKDEAHVDRILEADAARRASIGTYENLRAEQNAFGKQVAKAPKEEKPALVAQAKELAALRGKCGSGI